MVYLAKWIKKNYNEIFKITNDPNLINHKSKLYNNKWNWGGKIVASITTKLTQLLLFTYCSAPANGLVARPVRFALRKPRLVEVQPSSSWKLQWLNWPSLLQQQWSQ